jgi:hypothetical protein
VAEGYDALEDETPTLVNVSIKDGYGWTWAQYQDEEPLVFGRTVGCVSCHDTGNDLVRSVALPEVEE